MPPPTGEESSPPRIDSTPHRPRADRRSRQELRRSFHERFANAMQDLSPSTNTLVVTNSTTVSAAATSNTSTATATTAETGGPLQIDVNGPTRHPLQVDVNDPTSPPPGPESNLSDVESIPASNAAVAGSQVSNLSGVSDSHQGRDFEDENGGEYEEEDEYDDEGDGDEGYEDGDLNFGEGGAYGYAAGGGDGHRADARYNAKGADINDEQMPDGNYNDYMPDVNNNVYMLNLNNVNDFGVNGVNDYNQSGADANNAYRACTNTSVHGADANTEYGACANNVHGAQAVPPTHHHQSPASFTHPRSPHLWLCEPTHNTLFVPVQSITKTSAPVQPPSQSVPFVQTHPSSVPFVQAHPSSVTVGQAQPPLAPSAGQAQQPPLAPSAGQVQQPPLAPSAGQVQQPPLAPSAGKAQQPPLAPSAGKAQQPPLAPSAGQVQQPPLAPSAGQVQQSPLAPSAGKAQQPPLAPSAGHAQDPSLLAPFGQTHQRSLLAALGQAQQPPLVQQGLAPPGQAALLAQAMSLPVNIFMQPPGQMGHFPLLPYMSTGHLFGPDPTTYAFYEQQGPPQHYLSHLYGPRLAPLPQQFWPRQAPPQASRTRQSSPPRYDTARYQAQLDQHRQEQDDVRRQTQPLIYQLMLDHVLLENRTNGIAQFRQFVRDHAPIGELIQELPELGRALETQAMLNDIILDQVQRNWPSEMQTHIHQLVQSQIRVNEFVLGQTFGRSNARLGQLLEEQVRIVLPILRHSRDANLPTYDLANYNRLTALSGFLQDEVQRNMEPVQGDRPTQAQDQAATPSADHNPQTRPSCRNSLIDPQHTQPDSPDIISASASRQVASASGQVASASASRKVAPASASGQVSSASASGKGAQDSASGKVAPDSASGKVAPDSASGKVASASGQEGQLSLARQVEEAMTVTTLGEIMSRCRIISQMLARDNDHINQFQQILDRIQGQRGRARIFQLLHQVRLAVEEISADRRDRLLTQLDNIASRLD